MSLKSLITADVQDVFMNVSEFAEYVTLHLDGDVKLNAIVDIPDVTDSGEGSFPVTGSVSVATADLTRLRLKDGVIMEATIRGTVWQLYDQSTDEFGMTKYSIRRKHNDTNPKYSNIYDISGEQAVWSE
jgi:hypothetical protein